MISHTPKHCPMHRRLKRMLIASYQQTDRDWDMRAFVSSVMCDLGAFYDFVLSLERRSQNAVDAATEFLDSNGDLAPAVNV